jgi:hypothetical protein
VRIKVKNGPGQGSVFVNWYRVVNSTGRVGWQAKKPDDFRLVPYIPVGFDPFDQELKDDLIYWPEGEKDVDTLAKLGIPAFTFGGCGDGLPDDVAAYLTDRHIVIPADNDEPGRIHAEKKAGLAKNAGAASIKVLHFPELAEHGDISDYVAKGSSAEDLNRRTDEAPEWRHSELPIESSSGGWHEPDWSVLDDRRGELPDFPLDVFSPKWQEWVALASHGAGVNVDHVAVPLIAIFSSLVGGARRIQATRSWSEPFALWTAVIGFSGSGKTPGIDVTKRALAYIERTRKEKLGELQRKHETRLEVAKAAQKKWKKEVEESTEAGMPAPPCPPGATLPGEFVTPRLYISNATIERIATLLQANPRGLLLISDELAGLFLNMCRYTNGSDREFWLECWNGKHFVVERVNRPASTIDHLLVGITGGFQPDKLARSFEGDADGMYARVCFSWPRDPSYRPLTNDIHEIEPDIVNALCRAIDLEAGDADAFAPRNVLLSKEALIAFEQFRQLIHDNKTSLDGREREWWAKGPSHVLRLAGTVAYLSWSLNGGAEPSEIDAPFMKSAVRLWHEYFWPHARAAVRQIGLSDRHSNARRVLRWIKAHGRREIGLKDIRREALCQALDAKQTESLLNSLEQTGWLRKGTEQTGGRPAYRWAVNPLLFRGAESAESAERSGATAGKGLSALPALPASHLRPDRRPDDAGGQANGHGPDDDSPPLCAQCHGEEGAAPVLRRGNGYPPEGVWLHKECVRFWSLDAGIPDFLRRN